MFGFLFFFIIAYFFGSLPLGYLIVKKKKGADIRTVGSGATGSTNVSRVLGVKWGIIAGILDALKAYLPILWATYFLPLDWELALVALAPVLGHIYPCFLQFKGGKGIATMLGSLAALPGFGFYFLLITLFYALLYFSIFKVSSVFSLSFSASLPLVCYLFAPQTSFVFLGLILLTLIWWAHRENIARINTGEELQKKIDFSGLVKMFKK